MDLHKIVTKSDALLPGDECPNCGHVFWNYRDTDDDLVLA